MPKLPWWPFYGRDFFNDPKVLVMSWAQRGMYLKLLDIQWIEGYITADVALSCVSASGRKRSFEMQEMKAVVYHCFTSDPLNPTHLLNARMDRIRAEQLEKEAQRHARAVRGGQAAQAQRKVSSCSTQGQQVLSHSESEPSEDSGLDAEATLPNGFSSAQARTEPRKHRPQSALDVLDSTPIMPRGKQPD